MDVQRKREPTRHEDSFGVKEEILNESFFNFKVSYDSKNGEQSL